MATYYFPLKVTISSSGSVYNSASNSKPRFKILIATGSTAANAQANITGSTTCYAYCAAYYGDNQFWVTMNTSASTYMAVGVVNPYSAYITTNSKLVQRATNESDSPYAFSVQMSPASTLTTPKRKVTYSVIQYLETYSTNPKSMSSGAWGSINISTESKYITCSQLADVYMFQQIPQRPSNSYVTWENTYFEDGQNDFNVSNTFVADTNDLYWTGTTITLRNCSVSTGLSLTAFDVSATTTANTTVSVFHLSSAQSIGADSLKSVTVSHPAANLITAVSSVTLSVSGGGPAAWSGPIKAWDSKGIFNDVASGRTLTATKAITSDATGGTWNVELRVYPKTLSAGTGVSIRFSNTTNMTINVTYFKIWAKDVNGSDIYQEVITNQSNPTLAPGASNVILGKNIYQTSCIASTIKVTLQGYCSYTTGNVNFTVAGSSGQNFGTHTIESIDPAAIDVSAQWDIGSSNVSITGGTIDCTFSDA